MEKAENWKLKLTCRPQLLVSTSTSTERRNGCNQEEDASDEGGTIKSDRLVWAYEKLNEIFEMKNFRIGMMMFTYTSTVEEFGYSRCRN